MGRKAAVAQPPQTNTACQPAVTSSFLNEQAADTPPSGYPITISARAALRQCRLETSAAAALIEASVRDAEAGQQPPGEELGDCVRVTCPKHADRHRHKGTRGWSGAARPCRPRREEERPERHAEQLPSREPNRAVALSMPQSFAIRSAKQS